LKNSENRVGPQFEARPARFFISHGILAAQLMICGALTGTLFFDGRIEKDLGFRYNG